MSKELKGKKIGGVARLTQRKDWHADPANLHVHIAAVGQSNQVC